MLERMPERMSVNMPEWMSQEAKFQKTSMAGLTVLKCHGGDCSKWNIFFLHFFSGLKFQDVTVDEFIDVIDGNRKYCKCGSACRDVISCFLIFSCHNMWQICATQRHLCVQQAPWHIGWRVALLEIMQKRLVFLPLYLLLSSPFVL